MNEDCLQSSILLGSIKIYCGFVPSCLLLKNKVIAIIKELDVLILSIAGQRRIWETVYTVDHFHEVSRVESRVEISHLELVHRVLIILYEDFTIFFSGLIPWNVNGDALFYLCANILICVYEKLGILFPLKLIMETFRDHILLVISISLIHHPIVPITVERLAIPEISKSTIL